MAVHVAPSWSGSASFGFVCRLMCGFGRIYVLACGAEWIGGEEQIGHRVLLEVSLLLVRFLIFGFLWWMFLLFDGCKWFCLPLWLWFCCVCVAMAELWWMERFSISVVAIGGDL